MPTLNDCIALHEAAQRDRDPSRPIRVIRVACLPTRYWRRDADVLARNFAGSGAISRDSLICARLADTGDHLGLEYVGRANGGRSE